MCQCQASCCKGGIIAFNVFIWIIAAGLVGLGLWTLLDPHTVNRTSEFLVEIDGLSVDYSSADYTLAFAFGLGGVLFMAGLCGCCAAFRASRCLLGFFIFILILVFVFSILCIVSGVVFRRSALDKYDSETREFVKSSYMNDGYSDYSFNYIQHMWECCGFTGPNDYLYSAYFNATFSLGAAGVTAVSPFCCVMKSGYEFREKYWEIEDSASCQAEARLCQTTSSCPTGLNISPQIYTKGCDNAIETTIEISFYAILGFSVLLAFLVVLGLTCAGCMCSALRKKGKPEERYS